MKVAITGATGLLGANLAVLAREAGHTVVCTKRPSSDTRFLDGVDLVWVDAPLSDPDALTRAFDGCDRVFHCAASTSVLPRVTPALYAANVEGTDHVVQAVAAAGVRRLVHTSSTVAVGVSRTGEPCTEQSPWNLPEVGLDDGYATTKRESELHVVQAVRDGRIDAVVVNPGFLFGPYDAKPSSGRMILEVAAGRARIFTPGFNAFVDVRAVARGMLLAAERGASGERYILAEANLSYGHVFTKIAEVVGRPPPKVLAPRWLAVPAGWAGDLVQWATGNEQPVTSVTVAWGFEPGFVVDNTRARTELGWDPGSVDEGIRAAWAWFQSR
ncbi:MAG: NAD-dependent epimerase/dehydratase family protein [Alphaproteobacteria bacterium]|nr:NAD-dependent epimerase/dehydratase family protein [Alphaproteobacteria bacterium]